MKVIEGLLYSKEHEWVRVEGANAYVGISDYAQHSLGDIVFIELPEVDDEISKEDSMGVVESVKAASDIYSPVSGTILEVNTQLEVDPQLLNQDPYNNHIAVIELSDVSELEELMDHEAYRQFCEKQ